MMRQQIRRQVEQTPEVPRRNVAHRKPIDDRKARWISQGRVDLRAPFDT
jgi:hypothetical protein